MHSFDFPRQNDELVIPMGVRKQCHDSIFGKTI